MEHRVRCALRAAMHGAEGARTAVQRQRQRITSHRKHSSLGSRALFHRGEARATPLSAAVCRTWHATPRAATPFCGGSLPVLLPLLVNSGRRCWRASSHTIAHTRRGMPSRPGYAGLALSWTVGRRLRGLGCGGGGGPSGEAAGSAASSLCCCWGGAARTPAAAAILAAPICRPRPAASPSPPRNAFIIAFPLVLWQYPGPNRPPANQSTPALALPEAPATPCGMNSASDGYLSSQVTLLWASGPCHQRRGRRRVAPWRACAADFVHTSLVGNQDRPPPLPPAPTPSLRPGSRQWQRQAWAAAARCPPRP